MQTVLLYLNLALVCTCLLAAFADRTEALGYEQAYGHSFIEPIPEPKIWELGRSHPIAVQYVNQEVTPHCPAESKPITVLHTQVLDAQNPCMGIDISSLRETNRRLRSKLKSCRRRRRRPKPEPWLKPTPMPTSIPEPEPATEPTPKPCQCPGGWHQYENKCYKRCGRNGRRANFNNAADDCRRRGGQLAIETAENGEFLRRYAYTGCPGSGRRDCFLWIGLHYAQGRWQWVDGSPLTYSKWHPGEPNFMHNEHCVQVAQSYHLKRWYNNPCGRAHFFVCEQPCH